MQSFSAVVNRLKIYLTDYQSASFDLYARRLLEENRRSAITSVSDREGIYRRHFLESLAFLRALEDLGVIGSPVIDIGSGGGFPGVPISIVRPQLEMTLLEATGKKALFLEAMVAELRLEGVRVVQARAEELAHDPEHRASYRLAVARAVAPLRVLLELALPFLTRGGVLAVPKGSAAPREIREAASALAALGGEMEVAQSLEIPSEGPQQTLIVVRKTGETPERYPRRPGIPAKRPL